MGVIADFGKSAEPEIDAVINEGQVFVIRYFRALLYAQIVGVAVDYLVVFPQQICGHSHIVDVGWGHLYGMDIACPGIHSNMALHPEPPLVSLLGRVHFRIALLFRVLGGAGRVNDGSVHDCSAIHDVSALYHYTVDCFKKQLVQPVFLQQMPEIAQRCFVRHIVRHKIESQKLSHGVAVVDCVLRARGRIN